jgi:hypothetical protein
MSYQYRDIARQRLTKAKELLAAGDEDSLTYACLEARKCVEALAYDLLAYYLRDVSLKAMKLWQPDKVMKELNQIDPGADQSRILSMQTEPVGSDPPGQWVTIGEDRRLSAQRASKMYHQLGNYIHVPTIRQMEKSEPRDVSTIRKNVEQIVQELDHVVASTVWGVVLVDGITFTCVCETPIRRTQKFLDNGHQPQCGNCGQMFTVEHENGSEDWYFGPVRFNWFCDQCGIEREILQSKAELGLDVSCPACGLHAILGSITSWRVKQDKPDGAKTSPRQSGASPDCAGS